MVLLPVNDVLCADSLVDDPLCKGWASEKKHTSSSHNVILRNPQTDREIHLSPAEGDKYIKAQLSENRYDACICKEQVFTGLNCPSTFPAIVGSKALVSWGVFS